MPTIRWLFKDITVATLQAMVPASTIISLKAGELLIHEDGQGGATYTEGVEIETIGSPDSASLARLDHFFEGLGLEREP